MMCSIEELGSTREFYPEAPEYGIYIFDDSVQVGADAIEVLGLHDSVLNMKLHLTELTVTVLSVLQEKQLQHLRSHLRHLLQDRLEQTEMLMITFQLK